MGGEGEKVWGRGERGQGLFSTLYHKLVVTVELIQKLEPVVNTSLRNDELLYREARRYCNE